MYLPAHFNEPSQEALHGFIAQNPLGILFTSGAEGFEANHLPFELRVDEAGRQTLHAHVARNNPVWRSVQDEDEALVVFRGADAYVSPNWYPSKAVHHRQVPTWNYMVVHAHGRILVRDDERYVRGLVARLTRKHEASQPRPWRMTDGPKDYIDAMIDAIVGIEIGITRLLGKFKLSQNKQARDVLAVGESLSTQGDTEIGAAMLAIGSRMGRDEKN